VSAPDLAAFAMLAGLAVYLVTGGADFGAGFWDLVARGPRARDQRRLIEQAIAPLWEANHVWLIFVVVILFTAFPPAFSAAGIALHIPLTILLLGIVLRGSAFVFRQYGGGDAAESRGWGRVFAASSVVTPVFLGVVVAAVTSGEIRVTGGIPTTGFLAGWLGLFPLSVGLLTLVLCAFLAAVYLTVAAGDDLALREDFRARALGTGIALAPCALLAALSAGPATEHFFERFVGSWWTWPLQLATAVSAIGALVALFGRRYHLARVLAVAQATFILAGWGLGQRPYLIAPDVTIHGAASPPQTLSIMLVIVAAGGVLLIPSLYLLFRVFRKIS
jgi:cytochrome bd ubiquinol oxidase subunit II